MMISTELIRAIEANGTHFTLAEKIAIERCVRHVGGSGTYGRSDEGHHWFVHADTSGEVIFTINKQQNEEILDGDQTLSTGRPAPSERQDDTLNDLLV